MIATPAWDRLRAAADAPLRVAAPEVATVDELLIDDGGLPKFANATVVHAGTAREEGYEIWAARIADGEATTYAVRARRLVVRASDDALARLLGFDPADPPPDVEWTRFAAPAPHGGEPAARAEDVVCVCRGITRGQVEAAVASGWRTLDAVKRATKATFGECQSRRCGEAVSEIIGLASGDPLARITPRPPLVPVPASVLAAFAALDR